MLLLLSPHPCGLGLDRSLALTLLLLLLRLGRRLFLLGFQTRSLRRFGGLALFFLLFLLDTSGFLLSCNTLGLRRRGSHLRWRPRLHLLFGAKLLQARQRLRYPAVRDHVAEERVLW